MSAVPAAPGRLDVRVYGLVQGVGFRPFVHGLARGLGLTGWVRNDGRGVHIQVQGVDGSLRRFLDGVQRGPSPLALVERIEVDAIGPCAETGFDILDSERGRAPAAAIGPDTAVCQACLDELFDARDRRYRYAFLNCTACGPRYTITRALPYDRECTSMAPFALCPACRAEYDTPGDRRFHAEAAACPECGPRLALLDPHGAALALSDPVAAAVAALRDGAIVAIKGLGGFHLACDAGNAARSEE
ncbi:MAG: acylphosphatase, partial [Gammaproteobacteria bacterium]